MLVLQRLLFILQTEIILSFSSANISLRDVYPLAMLTTFHSTVKIESKHLKDFVNKVGWHIIRANSPGWCWHSFGSNSNNEARNLTSVSGYSIMLRTSSALCPLPPSDLITCFARSPNTASLSSTYGMSFAGSSSKLFSASNCRELKLVS